MKHTVYGSVMLMSALLVIAVSLVISGRSVRKNELQKTLDLSVRQTVGGNPGHSGKVEKEQEYLALFMENLIQGLESDSGLTVSVMGADAPKGLLSVKAEETFHHPGGRSGRVTADTTVLLEQYVLPQNPQYTIRYQINGQLYKQYCLTGGSHHMLPRGMGEGFAYWCDEKGEKREEGAVIVVTEDMVFHGAGN